jgi:coenzyme Q-binding protein COQ10
MPTIRARRNIPHGWSDLFALVLDLKSYPQFVPYCRQVKVLRQTTDEAQRTILVSRMVVGFPPVQVSYANRTIGDPASRRIEVDSSDGPLRHLKAVWTFEPRDEHSTQILFWSDYEFRSRMLAVLASGVLDRAFQGILDAFERRANLLLPRGDAAAG